MIVGNLLFIGIIVRSMLTINRGRHDAHTKLQIQAWHLEQMLPAKRPWQTAPTAKPGFTPSGENPRVVP